MPLTETGPPKFIDIEGVQIDLSSLSIRAAIASALMFIPQVGPILSAIASILPIRGKTQHLSVREGYANAQTFVDRFYPRLRETLKDEALRVAYTRFLSKRLYERYRSRWPYGLALEELSRLEEFYDSTTDELYTVYYLASYYFFRNGDAEHIAEEFDRDFARWVRIDLQEFLRQFESTDASTNVSSSSSLKALLVALPVTFFLKNLFKR